MIETEKKFARFVFELLDDDEDSDKAAALRQFLTEWAEYGMFVAIYNLGHMRAKMG